MSQTYEILAHGRAIYCRVCGRTSWNANDVAHRYCGACHAYHDDLARQILATRLELGDDLVRPR